ncbi:PAS domain S-box protein [Thiorhodococcus mannitoliphagus]|uniref:histidine kinase n=1 Tax=Thiorhodococcus mannitoliphagus TaxID=329406 RepID=A0A6P1E1Q4_9GAMM|nr:PAS domain S-box protein [Thiorhodococcus mannitoliphagus]NEX23261.1 PAS domain S-box protein [Thiorhodococcus mannitoliphagus]
MSRLAPLLCLLLLCAMPTRAEAERVLTLGVYAYRPQDMMQRRFQPLADYLSERLPDTRVELRALPLDLLGQAVHEGQVDLVLTNPRHYLQLRSRDDLTGVIATLIKRSFDGTATRCLGGVIFTRADRDDLATLADLKGQRIAIPNTNHMGGYFAPLVELDEAGLPPPPPDQLDVSGTHDAVVERVVSGVSDIGFVRTEILEELAASGRLDMDQIKIINRQALSDYPFMSSTRLYPEWPLIALPAVDEQSVRLVMAALYALDPNGPVAQSAHIAGFAPPADYLPLEQALRRLRMPPFDQRPHYGLDDLWSDYRLAIIAGALAFVAILGLSLLLFYRNRALVLSTARLRMLTQVQQALAEQTAALMRVSATDQDRAINALLRTAGRLLKADRAYLFQLDEDGLHASNTHEWCAEGVAPQLSSLQHIPLSETRWWWDQLGSAGRIVINDVDQIPDASLREQLRAQNISALFAIALLKDATNRGFVGFDLVQRKHSWHAEEILPFEAPISALGHALLRWRAERLLELRARCDEALLELPQLAETLPEQAFLKRALALAEELTGSHISFVHFAAEDQRTIELVSWSQRTLDHYCKAEHGSHYPVAEAGVWADALRQRAPVVVNDYAGYAGKRGLPEGHAELRRFISVPVVEDDQVVMLAGVGNKADDYDANDVESLQLIINATWRLLERRRSLAALRDSEARFLVTFEQAAVGIAQVGLDGRWLRVNHKLCEIVGYSSAELLEKRFQDITHPEDLDKDIRELQRVLVGEITSYSMEKRYIRKDGEIVWVNLTVALTLQEDKSPDYFIAVVEDIQARKQAEETLLKLAQALEQTPEAIVITNLDAEIEYVNAAFVEITGYLREEILGQNPRILHSDKTPKETYDALWGALTHGRPWQGELINRRKDGSEFIEHAIINPVRQPDGRVTHYVASKEDITEKKRLAEELERHRNHLEELVEARTAELAQARVAAEAASLAKSAFLANMSHEIRTPMNAVVGMTHLLQQDARPDQQARLGIVADSAAHLLSLINAVLDLSKIEAGKLELEESDFQLSAVFEHLCSVVGVQAKAKGLIFETDCDGVPDWLHGDPLRLRQALLNLATNAVKFTEHGQVSVQADVLEEDAAGLRLRFRVEDTGIGISEADQARLFQSFEQVDASISRHYGGSGLGLAISRHLAEMMGGKLEVESQAGAGSRFSLEVRMRRGRGTMPEQAPPTLARAPASPCYSGVRVLLVEDNAINCEVAMELLSAAGLDVDTAQNGAEAVSKVGQHDYDLVLMDMQMPVMDGLSATRAIRQLPKGAAIPILAMTANAFEEDRRACFAAGMNDFVVKPVDPDLLFASLARWVQPPASGNALRKCPSTTSPLSQRGDSGDFGRHRSHRETTDGHCLSQEATFAPAPSPPDQLPAALEPLRTPELERALAIFGGDVPRFLRLLQSFSKSYGGDADTIRERLDAGEVDEIRLVTHRLKGAAGSLGLSALEQAASLLDTAVRRKEDPDRLSACRDEVSQALHALAAALAELPEDAFATAADAHDPGSAQTLLDELDTLLRQDDTQAQTLLTDHQDALGKALGKTAFAPLAKAIESFEYQDALVMLRNALAARDRAIEHAD